VSTGPLVEHVSVSIVVARFGQDDHRYKPGSHLLKPTGVLRNARCCGHRTMHRQIAPVPCPTVRAGPNERLKRFAVFDACAPTTILRR